MVVDLRDTLGILIAALGGAAVGLEREWSGHATGPRARFAGIRTFTLLGLLAGLEGWLWSNSLQALAALLLAGTAALIVAAYMAASRVEIDGTTEMAAFVVLVAGIIAGMHELRLASATIAVTTLLLVEKSRLHKFVERLDDASLRAGLRFAVMAVVILPILPAGPYGPLGGVRPRQLWAMVLFFSGLSFAGYIARRWMGSKRGYPIAGMLGAIVSSTNVTLSFSRASRSEADAGMALATGVIGASAVMCLRVLIASAVLNPSVSIALIRYLIAPFFVAVFIAWWGIRKEKRGTSSEMLPRNPLQFTTSLQMAVLFQAVLFGVRWAQGIWGEPGVLLSAGALGLTDVDALVVSMAKDTSSQLPAMLAAKAITIGVVTNTFLKICILIGIGVGEFRRIAALGLLGAGAACIASLAWLW